MVVYVPAPSVLQRKHCDDEDMGGDEAKDCVVAGDIMLWDRTV